ncbi:hypothetical protein S245_067924, partial [Arachis hypogaea]
MVLSSRRFLAGSLNSISAMRSSDSVLILEVVSSGLPSAISGCNAVVMTTAQGVLETP